MRQVLDTTPDSAEAVHLLPTRDGAFAPEEDTPEARYARFKRVLSKATPSTLTPDGFQLYLIAMAPDSVHRMYFDQLEKAIEDQETEMGTSAKRFKRFY
jgi:hypothetical protein